MVKKYSDIRKSLLKNKENWDDNACAYVTHYLQSKSNGVRKYYKTNAEILLPNLVNESEFNYGLPFEFDVPYPPIDMPEFKFIDLFAGIGGFRIAFQDVKGKCVFSSEWDKFAKKTYEANFGEVPFGDITKIKAENIPDHDVLCAGFPCQPFSMIGKREGFEHSTQGTLFYDIERIIGIKRPKVFLLENVQGLLTHDGGNTIKVILRKLKELNYTTFLNVIDASDYGIPQKRKRVYFVGFNNDVFNKESIKFCLPKKINKVIGIGKYIDNNVKGYSISKHLQESYIFKQQDGKPEIVDQSSDIPVKTLVSTYHKIQRLTGTFVRDGETGLRLLTENECKAIMGFEKKFLVPVSRTQMYRQFGNSVVVPVIKMLAKEIVKILSNPDYEFVKENRNCFTKSEAD